MAEPRNPSSPQGAGNRDRTGMNVNPESDNAHPVATGVGAVGGAAAGVAAGAALGGPVGSVVGGVAGAVVGGMGGSAVGQAFDPAEEDRYWRESYSAEPYYEAGRPYDDYGPAYSLGITGPAVYGGSFETAEPRMAQDWERQRGGSSLSWEQAREPSRSAWRRVEQRYPVTGDGQLMGSSDTHQTGGAAGSTYSTRPQADGDRESNTVRSSPVKDLGGTVGSANRTRRLDVSSGEDSSLAAMPHSDSTMPGSEAYENNRRSGQRGDAADRSASGSGVFGAVGGAQSASAGDTSDTEDVVDVLNDLLETCRDGEYGFNLCAEHTQHPELRRALVEHAGECRSAARELMDCIRQLGGEVEDSGSMMGSVHRGWVSMKGTLAGYSDRAMAAEAERGEDAALARYHKALDEDLPADIRALVQRQADGVRRNHDDMKRWRDRLQDRV